MASGGEDFDLVKFCQRDIERIAAIRSKAQNEKTKLEATVAMLTGMYGQMLPDSRLDYQPYYFHAACVPSMVALYIISFYQPRWLT